MSDASFKEAIPEHVIKMQIRRIGQATKLYSIDAGTVFSAQLREKQHICVAIEGPKDQPAPDAVVLYPSHPALDKTPGLLLASVFSSKSIYAYDRAYLEYDPSSENILTETWDVKSNYAIYFVGDTPHLKFAVDRHEWRYVDLLTGRYASVDTNDAVAILHWRIVWRDDLGQSHTICEF